MNTDNENTEPEDTDDENTEPETSGTPTDRRPLGYWLRVVDGLITREFAVAFENEGVTRRDWMLLNLLSGDVEAPGFAERLARKGKRLRRLEDLGWAEEQGDGTWALTDAGREAKERLGGVVSGIRSRVAGAVTPDDYATMMASLEAIARELGWDESADLPRSRGWGWGGGPFGGPRPFRPEIRFGWGPNRHRGFEPGRPGRPGTDPQHGTSHRDAAEHSDAWGGHRHGDEGCHGHHGRGHFGHHRHDGHGHGDPRHGGHGHGGDAAETAYERGFVAGFDAAKGRPEGDSAPGSAA